MKALRSSLVKQNILPPLLSASHLLNDEGMNLSKNNIKIDEIVAESRKKMNKNKQILPKLRLTRPKPKPEKIRVPVTITILQFPCEDSNY